MGDLDRRTLEVQYLPAGFLKSEEFLRELTVKLVPLMPGGVVEKSMIDYITLIIATNGRTFGDLRSDFAEFFGESDATQFANWLWNTVENEISNVKKKKKEKFVGRDDTTVTDGTQPNEQRSVVSIRRGKSDSTLPERGRRTERISSANRRDHSRSRDPPRLQQRRPQELYRRGRGFDRMFADNNGGIHTTNNQRDLRRRTVATNDDPSSSSRMEDTQFVVHLGKSRSDMAVDRPRVVVTLPDQQHPLPPRHHNTLHPAASGLRSNVNGIPIELPPQPPRPPLPIPQPPFRVRLSALRSDKADQSLLETLATNKRGYQMMIVNAEECLVGKEDCKVCWHFWSIHGCRNGKSCIFNHELPLNSKAILEIIPPLKQKPEVLIALYMSDNNNNNDGQQTCSDIATPEQWIYQKTTVIESSNTSDNNNNNQQQQQPKETKLSRVTIQMPRDFVDEEDEDDEEEDEDDEVIVIDEPVIDTGIISNQNGGSDHNMDGNKDTNGSSQNNDNNGNTNKDGPLTQKYWVLSDTRLADVELELTEEVAIALSGLQQRTLLSTAFPDRMISPHSAPPTPPTMLFAANRGRPRHGRGAFASSMIQRGWSPTRGRGRGRGSHRGARGRGSAPFAWRGGGRGGRGGGPGRGGFAPPFRGGRGRGFRGLGRGGGIIRGRGGYHRGGFNNYNGRNMDRENNQQSAPKTMDDDDDIATINASTDPEISKDKNDSEMNKEGVDHNDEGNTSSKLNDQTGGDETGPKSEDVADSPPEKSESNGDNNNNDKNGNTKPAKKREIELCKFNEYCKRRDCFYRHTKARLAFRNDHLTQTVRLTSGERSSIVCKFDLKCTRIGCVYRHPQRDAQTSQWIHPLHETEKGEETDDTPIVNDDQETVVAAE